MGGFKLCYFNVRGRAQSLRYMCADNDIPLEEQDTAFADWPKIKPTTVFGQLPVLHDGEFQVAQSNAILRYVSRKHGLYGKTDEEKAKIDMLNDQQEDVRLTYLRLIYQEFEKKDEYVKTIPEKLATLETFLAKNKGGKGYCVGDHVSFVDYTLFDLLDNLLVLAPTCLDTLPTLKGFHDRFAKRDKLAKFRATERFTKMPINGNGKQ